MKLLSCFSSSNLNKDGLRGQCKLCRIYYSKKYYCQNVNAVSQKNKLYVAKNRQKTSEYQKEYRLLNAQKCIENNKRYFKNHPGIAAAKLAKYRATKLNATPKWLSESQLQEIKQFYKLAKELSWLSESSLEVDHIIPLQGKNVTGLHVPWNLQILPKSMNQSKGNK